MNLDRNGLEILDRKTCLDLMATVSLGRLGVVNDGRPIVLPVNFKLVDDAILIRTAPGTKLSAAAAEAEVSLEVDHFDSMSHNGWSVVAEGIARLASADAYPPEVVRRIPRWAPQGDPVLLQITIDRIAGRRLVAGSWLMTEVLSPSHAAAGTRRR